MLSSHIDLGGELPMLEHRQRHTQALLLQQGQSPCAPTDLLMAQVVDLMEDATDSGLDQAQTLAICMEAVRQLKSSDPDEDWQWRGQGIELTYRRTLMAGPADFLRQNIDPELSQIKAAELQSVLDDQGPATALEVAEGLPDPERLIVATAIVILKCYLQALDGVLNARYFVGGQATLVSARRLDSPNGRKAA